MEEKVATLISAFEHATRHMRVDTTHHEAPPLDPLKPWAPHFSALFRETMRQRSIRAGVHVSPLYTDEHANANEQGIRIGDHKNYWVPVIVISDLQSLSNQGDLIAGSYINPHRGKMGHLGIVYPIESNRSEPLLRDGNIHSTRSASSYGAIPAGSAFHLRQTSG